MMRYHVVYVERGRYLVECGPTYMDSNGRVQLSGAMWVMADFLPSQEAALQLVRERTANRQNIVVAVLDVE